MTLAFILVLIFISAVALLNNKYLNRGTGYLLAGAVSFTFVIGVIYFIYDGSDKISLDNTSNQ